jgi:Cu/Ag efflux pump CusA
MRRPRWAYGTVAILIVAGVAVLPQLGGRSMVPLLQDRDLLIRWQAMPGTSLAETSRITYAATRELRGIGGVRNVGAHLGRALMADQPVNVNSGELWVSIDRSADYDTTVSAVKTVVQGYPGLSSDVITYPQDRVRSADTGTRSDLVVRVYGHDLTVLASKADQIRRLLADVSGVQRPTVAIQAEEPTLQVQVNLAAAERYGITPGDVRRASATFFAGLPVGSVYEEQKVFDVVVWGMPSARYTPTNVRDLLIDTPAGGHVRLGDVAEVSIRPTPTVIRHDNISRSIDVTATVSGRGFGSVMSDVKSLVRTVAMPVEFHAEVLGDAGRQQNQRWRVLTFVLVVSVGIFLLLQAAFGSWRLATLLMITLPLAGVGSAVAAFLIDVKSSGALIGVLAVLGIAARNGILLVSSYRRREHDGERLGPELVLQATRERVEPVVLTALTTAAALLPLLLWGSVAGTEVNYPLAVVVLGGLVTATLVTVFVLPALYLRFSPRASAAR